MDNDDYMLDDDFEEVVSDDSTPQSHQNKPSSFEKGQNLRKKIDDIDKDKVKEGFSDVKSGNVKEGLGKINEGTNFIDTRNGLEKAGHNIKETGKSMKETGQRMEDASKGAKNANKVSEKTAKGAEKAAKVAETGGKALEGAGKAQEAASAATKGIGAGVGSAGDAANTIGTAADVTGVGAVAGVPLNIAGTTASIVGKTTQGIGTAGEGVGRAEQAAGKSQQAVAKGVENGAKGLQLGNKIGQKFGDGLGKAGKITKETGEKVEQFGEKVEQTGKDLGNITKPFIGTMQVIKKIPKFLVVAIIISAFLSITFLYNETMSPIIESSGAFSNYNNNSSEDAESKGFFSRLYEGLNGDKNSNKKFYDELQKWYDQSNGQLDVPLIFSALYYPDIVKNTSKSDFSEDDEEDDGIDFSDIFSLNDDDANAYNKGKIKRLRILCQNYLDSSNNPVSEEDYKEFLKTKYVNKKSEYKKYFKNMNDEEKESTINLIVKRIYEYRTWYSQVYGYFAKYSGNSENYENSCSGAIDSNLVNELRLPVDIPNGKQVEFDSSTAYGVSNGLVHNGVDLTSSSAGINENSPVYSIANGVVDSVGKDSEKQVETNGEISNYLFIGDSRYEGLSPILSKYGTVAAVTSSNSTDWSSVTKSGSGTVLGKSITLPASVNGVSVMLGVNDLNVEKLKEVLNNLHSRYPSVTIYVNSVYHVGTNYKDNNVDNSSIDTFNSQIKTFCDSNSWATYIDITAGLYEANGNLRSDFSPDGLHILTADGQTAITNNIIGKLKGNSSSDAGGSWIKIKHENIVVSGTKYTFYSVYKNLNSDSVKLKKGKTVTKSMTIGTVGKTNSGNVQLHFEFRNQSDQPIDPTNLFVKCVSGNSGVIVGDTNEEKVWNYLTSAGYSKPSTAAAMGNFAHESGFYGDRVQGDIPYSNASPEYTAKVDNGTISEYDFVNGGPGGGGYGLAQWTYFSRKQALYNKSKTMNTSIGNLEMQLNFLKDELDGVNYYSWLSASAEDNWKNTTEETISSTWHDFCRYFENPEECSTLRQSEAIAIYNKYKNYVAPKVVVSGNGGKVNKSDTGSGYPEGIYTSSTGFKFKQYLQYGDDWYNEPYSEGNLQNAGCGPTSVAIIISGLVNSNITPVDTARGMGGAGNGGTTSAKMEAELAKYGLSSNTINRPSNETIINELRRGNVLIVGVDAQTPFTASSSGHIMTIVDVNSEGKVYIINPNSLGNNSMPSGWYNPSEVTVGNTDLTIIQASTTRN